MKIAERQLRSFISKELLRELFGIQEKIEDYTKDALSSYFKNNADEIARGIVPGIPFDGNIIESYFEKNLAESLRENSDLLADCIVGFFNPLAAADSSKGETETV
jgi:hypothetical protein